MSLIILKLFFSDFYLHDYNLWSNLFPNLQQKLGPSNLSNTILFSLQRHVQMLT